MSAMAEITFRCSGCDATAPHKEWITRKFHGINGRDYGFGVWRWNLPDLSSLMPEDWEMDPLTCADYCPKCAAEVWPDDQEGRYETYEEADWSGADGWEKHVFRSQAIAAIQAALSTLEASDGD